MKTEEQRDISEPTSVQDAAVPEKKEKQVQAVEYEPPFHISVLSFCNTLVEIAMCHTVYQISGSLILAILAWILLLSLEIKYLLFRKPDLGRVCMENLQVAREEIHSLLPEISLINLGLFVLSRLIFLYL